MRRLLSCSLSGDSSLLSEMLSTEFESSGPPISLSQMFPPGWSWSLMSVILASRMLRQLDCHELGASQGIGSKTASRKSHMAGKMAWQLRACIALQRTHIWFQATLLGGSQPPVTLVLGELLLFLWSLTSEHPTLT